MTNPRLLRLRAELAIELPARRTWREDLVRQADRHVRLATAVGGGAARVEIGR